MARARLLKPGFFTDDAIAACQPLARLLFAGLWTLADKKGRLRDQPQVIAGALLPFDLGVSTNDLLAELEAHDLIVRYVADGKRVIQVRNFTKHQHPHPKEPDSELPGPPENTYGTPELVPERPEQVPERQEVAVAVLPESFPSYPSVPSLAGVRASSEALSASTPASDDPEQDPEQDVRIRALRDLDDLSALTGSSLDELVQALSLTPGGKCMTGRSGITTAPIAWVRVTADQIAAKLRVARAARSMASPGPEPWQLEREARRRQGQRAPTAPREAIA